jgi:hypothetical protein
MLPKAITDSNVNETGTQDFDGGSGTYASFVITSSCVLLAMDLQARLKVPVKHSPDNSAAKYTETALPSRHGYLNS